jgi:hypothetical protein
MVKPGSGICWKWVGVALLVPLTGCSGGDDDDKQEDKGPTCPTTEATTVALTNVAPAAGASVKNSMIVHTFQTVDVDAQLPSLELATLPTHTAGAVPQPLSPTVMHVARPSGSGTDFLYAFTVTWPTAPGHVTLIEPALYIDPTTNCKFQFPTPLFDYDITP